ncbi:MAG: cryptochrome/photolyase family protein [Aequoribacter sp.]|uniref:cryptochrome/photolyase family protein n=1 Tax=Aequoribacter sp. TaxID=2847771 RepID=UPI003C54460F
MTKTKRLTLILADQLSWQQPALLDSSPDTDTLVFAEVAQEATYVRHNKHKITFLFAAMRKFADQARNKGYSVRYFTIDQQIKTLLEAVQTTLVSQPIFDAVHLCEPGEYRLKREIETWADQLGVPCVVHEDSRFLCSHSEFKAWADRQKTFRMEYFYRGMRKRLNVLMDDDQPVGGQWNYDADNRSGWRNKDVIPKRIEFPIDATTQTVINTVEQHFSDHPGDLTQFSYATDATQAQAHLAQFIQIFLPRFGQYQDALAEESTTMFHGLIGLYLNAGLLEPADVCNQAEAAYRAGSAPLAATEGFIRQIIGWREYVRGIYWYHMPRYATLNTWDAATPLPSWFWSGNTHMRCLHKSIQQSLDTGYAHHIQRLMVIGNFSLLAGLSVSEVCDWYLAMYVDAYEWVELPNTLGMALNADDGIMASKPYAASGKYIAKQGNHCQQCPYDPKLTTGPKACPYNSLYWRFIDRHLDSLSKNPRMGLITGQWRKRAADERESIVQWADQLLDRVESL